MKKLKMIPNQKLSFEEGCNKYLEYCKQRNLRQDTIRHYPHHKKSIDCKAIIQKHSKDFDGTLEDPDVIKLCGCSRNSYYKYKKELKFS